MSRLRHRTSQPTSNINIFHYMFDVKSLCRPCEFIHGGPLFRVRHYPFRGGICSVSVPIFFSDFPLSSKGSKNKWNNFQMLL
ncbi:hypothetical protein VIGAN_11242300, partial [Vigna angularis var. angularis]